MAGIFQLSGRERMTACVNKRKRKEQACLGERRRVRVLENEEMERKRLKYLFIFWVVPQGQSCTHAKNNDCVRFQSALSNHPSFHANSVILCLWPMLSMYFHVRIAI